MITTVFGQRGGMEAMNAGVESRQRGSSGHAPAEATTAVRVPPKVPGDFEPVCPSVSLFPVSSFSYSGSSTRKHAPFLELLFPSAPAHRELRRRS